MLDKRLAATILSVALVSAVAVAATLLPDDSPAEPLLEPISDIPLNEADKPDPSKEEQDSGWLYLLREHDGRIAIFAQDGEKPVMVLDKWVKHLPDYDRIQMQEGIEVYSEEELAARIEDFTS